MSLTRARNLKRIPTFYIIDPDGLAIGLGKISSRFRLGVIMLVTLSGVAFADDADLAACQNDNPSIGIPACTKMIASGEEKPEFLGTLYGLRGIAYLRAGEYAKAVPDFTATMQYGSDSKDILKLRAMAYFYSGDSPHAIADYSESIRNQPDDAAALNGRAFVFLKMKNYDAALADYNAALKRQPDNAQVLYGRGLAKRAKGDNAGAQKDMTQAKNLMPAVADGFIQAGVDSKP